MRWAVGDAPVRAPDGQGVGGNAAWGRSDPSHQSGPAEPRSGLGGVAPADEPGMRVLSLCGGPGIKHFALPLTADSEGA